MSAQSKSRTTLLISIFAASLLTTPRAFAITVEVAKNCSALSAKAYPLRVPGNPAAGRLNGTGADYQKYFNQCVANGGTMNEQQTQQGGQSGPPASNQGGASNGTPAAGHGAPNNAQAPK